MAATATATSKSAVSRRSVAATETALAELLGADLSGLDLVAFMVDGVRFAESCCVVALRIGVDDTKYPWPWREGPTANATLVTDLLVGQRQRGLDVTRQILAVLDGWKALRCQQHKIRTVRGVPITISKHARSGQRALSLSPGKSHRGEAEPRNSPGR